MTFFLGRDYFRKHAAQERASKATAISWSISYFGNKSHLEGYGLCHYCIYFWNPGQGVARLLRFWRTHYFSVKVPSFRWLLRFRFDHFLYSYINKSQDWVSAPKTINILSLGLLESCLEASPDLCFIVKRMWGSLSYPFTSRVSESGSNTSPSSRSEVSESENTSSVSWTSSLYFCNFLDFLHDLEREELGHSEQDALSLQLFS